MMVKENVNKLTFLILCNS